MLSSSSSLFSSSPYRLALVVGAKEQLAPGQLLSGLEEALPVGALAAVGPVGLDVGHFDFR